MKHLRIYEENNTNITLSDILKYIRSVGKDASIKIYGDGSGELYGDFGDDSIDDFDDIEEFIISKTAKKYNL